MIISFSCKETEKIWNEHKSRKFPSDIQNRAIKKLDLLDTALTLDDLRIFPANRLELLSGNRKGQMSIRINDKWRICFIWNDGYVEQAEIVDYH